MPKHSQSNRERWYASALIALAGVAWFAASQYPGGRVWGFNHLAFVPSIAQLGVGAALAGLLVLIWLVPTRRAAAGKRENRFLAPVMFVGWIAAVALMQAATPLLGDGYLRADELNRTDSVSFGVMAFLPGWLGSVAEQFMKTRVNLSGVDVLAWLSSAAGVVFAFGLFFLWPRAVASKGKPGSRLSAFWLLGAGSSVIYFGYVESYGPGLAFLTLFAVAAIAHRNGRLGWGWPVILWTAAVWSHLSALGWAPALLYAMYARRENERPFAVPLATAIGAMAVSLGAMYWFVPSSPTTLWSDHFLPVFAGAYSLVHWRHWFDAINHLALMVPFWLAFAGAPKSKAKESEWRGPLFVLLWAPSVAALVTFNPKLGWWRDWDVFALLSAPAIVVLTAMLAKRQREWSRPRIIAAVGLAAIPFVMWTWINVSETSSVTRFERMLELDPDRALNAYESLGRYHSERREWVQTVRILGTALATRDHHRLYTQRGIAFSGIGQYDSALAAFRRAVALDSLYADGQFGCGQMLWLLHRTDEGLPYLKRAVAMDTTRVQYRFQLALALRDAGYPDSALPHLEYATRMVSNQPVYADIYAENLFETGHADSAVTVLRNMMQRFPSLASPYAKLAWMFYERNDVANANSALIGYEKRTRPQDRSARTIGLRRTLDSIRAATDAPSE